MRFMKKIDKKTDKEKIFKTNGLSRRSLIKLGAGVAAAGVLKTTPAAAQQRSLPSPSGPLAPVDHSFDQHFPDIRESQEVITTVQPFYITETTYGWTNNSGRAWGKLFHSSWYKKSGSSMQGETKTRWQRRARIQWRQSCRSFSGARQMLQ
jgi:hypothetical protein